MNSLTDTIAQDIQSVERCSADLAARRAQDLADLARPLEFSLWRHGGWNVHSVRYPGGDCGCVSRNYPDGRWRIVYDPRRSDLGMPGDFTFKNREAAARAEQRLALEQYQTTATA